MSKDKPEVGDVWTSLGNYKKYILATSKNAVRFLAIGNWGRQPKIITQNIDIFMRITTYLGISKGDIEELFEISDETFIDGE